MHSILARCQQSVPLTRTLLNKNMSKLAKEHPDDPLNVFVDDTAMVCSFPEWSAVQDTLAACLIQFARCVKLVNLSLSPKTVIKLGLALQKELTSHNIIFNIVLCWCHEHVPASIPNRCRSRWPMGHGLRRRLLFFLFVFFLFFLFAFGAFRDPLANDKFHPLIPLGIPSGIHGFSAMLCFSPYQSCESAAWNTMVSTLVRLELRFQGCCFESVDDILKPEIAKTSRD